MKTIIWPQCNVVFVTNQTSTEDWYFDYGCSRHMTDNRSYFSELKKCYSRHVIFCDGAKGRILTKENIIIQIFPDLMMSDM